MKQYLLPENGRFYKAALHVHTNISDGRNSPEEMKGFYRNAGYQIVAFTDHQVLVCHNDLTEDGFLALNGVEFAKNHGGELEAKGGWPYIRTYHLNYIAKRPDIDFLSVCSEGAVWLKQSLPYLDERTKNNPFRAVYSIDGMNEIIRRGNEEGFLVVYNHPLGNRHSYPDYIGLKGLWGIEWYNKGSNEHGVIETIGPMDDLLHAGERVMPIAADDSHSFDGCLGGFVMVKAADLGYETITRALEAGDFYSSTGPCFDELTFEDGKLNLSCSPCRSIYVTTERRVYFRQMAEEGKTVDGASFDLSDYIEKSRLTDDTWREAWFRVTLYDREGHEAHTRAYFLADLIGSDL